MKFKDTSLGGQGRDFPETVWDIVRRLGDSSTRVRRAGLEELCRGYWKPIYRYIRLSWAKSNEEAKDLTQAFFLWLMETERLGRYERERGSFRTFLKTVLKNFLRDREEAMDRLKRGGGVRLLSLQAEDAALEGSLPDPGALDPEKEFDRSLRSTLVEHAVERVRGRYMAGAKAIRFRVFEEYELGDAARPTYAQVADRLSLKEGDVRNFLFEVRGEIRREIRAELEGMTGSREELEEEWNALFDF